MVRRMVHLTSGPLDIRQSPQGDTYPRGFYFGPEGLRGWDDGATMRAETTARPQAHGDFDIPGFLAGRMVELWGWCYAGSIYELEHYRDELVGHGADGGKFPVVVERNGRTLTGVARLASGTKPTFVDVGTGRRARWEATWWMPDPRKYGEPFTEGPGVSVEVVHRGNFPALPVLMVTGVSPGGYTVTGPGGRQIVVTRPLVSGIPHSFDMATARLSVGGVRVLGGVAKAELWSLPAHSVSTVSVSGGLQLTVTGRETFI